MERRRSRGAEHKQSRFNEEIQSCCVLTHLTNALLTFIDAMNQNYELIDWNLVHLDHSCWFMSCVIDCVVDF